MLTQNLSDKQIEAVNAIDDDVEIIPGRSPIPSPFVS